MHPFKGLAAGLLAGAAGTTALNAVTYLDMAWRGRPSSETPQKSVEALADRAGMDIPGEDEERSNRLQGLGPLLGVVSGTGVGAVAGLLRGLGARPGPLAAVVLAGGAAMAATDGAMTALGVTDPRKWDAQSWVSDAVPHLAYGAVTATALRRFLP